MARERIKAIVVDSSFLIAYHNTRDVHHAAAARAMVHLPAGKWGRVLLLEYVFLEVVTVLLLRRGHDVAVEVGTRLLAAEEIDFVPCSELFLDTLEAFRTQPTGALSFVDAAVAAAARARAGGYVATFDADFRELSGVTVIP
ncbi:MAG: PIN domain-containing protein [Gemmatimonadota bacterium]|nr:PIN domain-containing protein [Gemmatimonadota bacterium]